MSLSEIKECINTIKIEANKSKKLSAFVIGTTAKKGKERVVILPIRETSYALCGAVIVYATEDAVKIAKTVDGQVDILLVDAEQKIRKMYNLVDQVYANVLKSKILTFKGNDMTADAMDALLTNIMGSVYKKKIAVIGAGNLGSKVALKLVERGATVIITRRNIRDVENIAKLINVIKPKNCKGKAIAAESFDAAKNADAVLGFTQGIPAITPEMVAVMRRNGMIVDGGVGTIYPSAIKEAYKRGIKVIRLDMRAGFAGTVVTLLETDKFLHNVIGSKKINGINVVAGGVIGDLGDVIVDNIYEPKRVIGIADGQGGVLPDKFAKKYKDNIKYIKSWINA